MALDKLGLYNDALLLLGERAISSLSEDREPRRRLDGAYDRGAVDFCLELVRPNFAAAIATLNTPTGATTFTYSHSKPGDYVTLVEDGDTGTGGVYSDQQLDQPVNRYVIENDTILCDYDAIYVHYIRSGLAIDQWTSSFFRVVGAYLAKETATRLTADEFEKVERIFWSRVKEARDLEDKKAPLKRSSEPTVTLTLPWRRIYNDALLIMGLEEINHNSDDSNRRAKLDRALNAGIVEELLEDCGWTFGQVSTKCQYDPSAEPAWGHQRAIGKPDDLWRLDGIFVDEHMKMPLKDYKDEDQYWFCDYDEIYINYVDDKYLTNPSNWPTYFKRLVAARMANDAALSLRKEGADVRRAIDTWIERESNAKNVDAMIAPPRVIHQGQWLASRYRSYNRRRP